MSEASGALPAAGLEEIREHIAAAFDAVHVLTDEVRRSESRIIDGLGALAQGLDEQLGQDSLKTSLSAINRRLEGIGRVGPVLTDLAAWMAGVVERLDKVEADLAQLADEVQAYRRRTQLRARAPVVSDDQLEAVVNRIVDRIVLLMPQPAPEPERKRRR